jgi:acyl dehydratase
MGASADQGMLTTMAGLPDLAGCELGTTDWREMTQGEVDAFADATGDHQFIHVDPERARETPFGGTIAHGFLTLSLVAPITQRLLRVSDAGMAVNYGLDRVRFPAPLPVGAQWRGVATVGEVRGIEGGVQVHVSVTVEVRERPKPAMVADCLLRFYA